MVVISSSSLSRLIIFLFCCTRTLWSYYHCLILILVFSSLLHCFSISFFLLLLLPYCGTLLLCLGNDVLREALHCYANVRTNIRLFCKTIFIAQFRHL